jgi:transcription initiation factor TFIIIB Brf1 subunit/transcription initiation factor TFIIB
MSSNLRRGRPAHSPTEENRRMVEVLSGYGVSQADIARVVGIDEKTLRLRYATELDSGAAKVQAKLVGNLLRLAGGSDGTALRAIMFSLNCRFGWVQSMPLGKPEPLGKKEQAAIDAQTAHEGTEWEGLMERFDRLN